MVGNHSQECSKEESRFRDLIQCNELPQFRVDVYGNAVGQQPIQATTTFEIVNEELVVKGYNSSGYSLIDGDLIYSFRGNVENDPSLMRSCCLKN